AMDDAPWHENERLMTNLFSLQVRPEPGDTAFSDITELMPGECLVIERSNLSSHRSAIRWNAEPPLMQPEIWAERFGQELNHAVISAIGGHGPVASMLSGGLDSGPITVLASQYLAARGRALIATSWTLERFAQADERAWIETLGRHLGCRLELFAGDDMLPFSRLDPSMANPE
ncbi:MAG: asparagine synthase-related protein, partial [Wenzhouxiangellaceae bacterium]